jgi:hypothetical protein
VYEISEIMNEKAFRDLEHPWVRRHSFIDASSSDLLKFSPLVEGGVSGAPAAWVFDLDSTLFCTAPRNKRVLLRFLRQRTEFPSHWARMWAVLSPALQRYGIPQTFYYVFREIGLNDDEARAEARGLWKAYQDFWMEEFFLSRNIVFDTPYDGAVEFVRQIHARGYQVVYLTGRDADRARMGSYQVLRRWGFPMDQHCHLWLKPHRSQDDLEFKAMAAAKLRAQFKVHALIDNEPENLVMFAEKFPDAEIVLFHSIMSRREPQKPYPQVLQGRQPWRLLDF